MVMTTSRRSDESRVDRSRKHDVAVGIVNFTKRYRACTFLCNRYTTRPTSRRRFSAVHTVYIIIIRTRVLAGGGGLAISRRGGGDVNLTTPSPVISYANVRGPD